MRRWRPSTARIAPALLRVGLVLGVCTFATGAGAQPVAREEPADHAGVLTERFGAGRAEQLLAADDLTDQRRGVARLIGQGDEESLDALTDFLETGGPAARDPRLRLYALRRLGLHLDEDAVRLFYERELADEGRNRRGLWAELGSQARITAALALARHGAPSSLAVLDTALRRGGEGAAAAVLALEAYPPSQATIFLGGAGNDVGAAPMSSGVIELFARLGDLRAMPRLRAVAGQGGPLSTDAALALAELHDESPLPLLMQWTSSPDPSRRVVGATALARLGAPGAAEAIATLLDDPATAAAGLGLAYAMPSPELVPALSAGLEATGKGSLPLRIGALGRAGGPDAAAALAPLLDRPDVASQAAMALARMPGSGARAQLEAELAGSDDRRRATALRAGVIRLLSHGDELDGFDEAIAAGLSSDAASLREVAVLAGVASGELDVDDFLPAPDALRDLDDDARGLMAAAAAGAVAQGPAALWSLRPLLTEATDPADLAALGVSLLVDPTARGVPTADLLAWVESGGAIAPLAARALPSRDDAQLRPALRRLLASPSPLLRAHVAWGFADDPEPSASQILAAAYEDELQPSVRRAIVRALSARTEPQRLAPLELAAALDPDPTVRTLAAQALAGRRLDRLAVSAGHETAWIEVARSGPAAGRISAVIVRSDGLALPVVATRDDTLTAFALPPGPSHAEVAAQPRP